MKAVANDIEVETKSKTDPELARDIVDALRIDVTVPENRIKVEVMNGHVTLDGAVDAYYQHDAVRNCVRRVRGVRGVEDNISIKPLLVPAEIKSKIEEALCRSAEVDSRRVTVTTADGTVTLDGNLRSFAERDAAEQAAWAAPGVSLVIDRISIVP